jgi:hypothetical protein
MPHPYSSIRTTSTRQVPMLRMDPYRIGSNLQVTCSIQGHPPSQNQQCHLIPSVFIAITI